MPNHRRGRGRGANSWGNTNSNTSNTSETTFQIAGGIFSRLKFPCPQLLTANPQKYFCPSNVPITFRSLPMLISAVCYEMSVIKLRSYSESDDYIDELNPTNKNNKAILIKGGLILAEMKVYYAQRCHSQRQMQYSHDELDKLRDMARFLPKPLMEYLDCIGTVRADGNCAVVTPVLAQGGPDAAGAGALTLAPCQLAPLLAGMRRGVRAGSAEDVRAALQPLGLRWEEYEALAEPPAEPVPMVRLADDCFRFWTTTSGTAEAPRYTIRWNSEDSRLFERVMSSVRYCKGGKDYFVEADLSRGVGSPAQFVQTPQWKETTYVDWFIMTDIDDEFISKGAFFGFSGFDSKQVQPSRFTGTIETSYRSGQTRLNISWNVKKQWEKPKTSLQFGTIIPVTFSGLPRVIDLIGNKLRVTYYVSISAASKAVLTKAGLILAEAKVYFAQIASKSTTLHPGQMVVYSFEQFSVLKRMPKFLPKPLAVYLECLGITRAGACGQEVTPVLAQGAPDAAGAGALTLAPCQLAPLLAGLRRGVRAGSAEDVRAALQPLGLRWEEYEAPAEPPAEPVPMVRLADDCFRFWTATSGTAEAPRYTIRWNDEDSILFQATIRSMFGEGDFLVYTDLSHGQGSPAQLVQFSRNAEADKWFAMTDVDDVSVNLGSGFQFGDFAGEPVQPSRFTGTLDTAYISGMMSKSTFKDLFYSISG